MARFDVYLIGSGTPIRAELRASDLDCLAQEMMTTRFLKGRAVNPDEDGTCNEMLIPICRIQFALSVSG